MIVRFVLFFLLVIASTVTNAQVRLKLNYNKDWMLTTPDSAVFIRVCIYDTINNFFAGPVVDLYLSGKPQMKGTYKLRRKEGEFTSYYENGNVESTGLFQNNVRVGVWKYYYPDGGIKEETEFLTNGDPPKVMTFNDPSGKPLLENGSGKWHQVVILLNGDKVEISGEYKNGLKHGHWQEKGPGKGNLLDEWYKNGQFIEGLSTYGLLRNQPSYYSRDYYSFPLPWKFEVTEMFEARDNVNFETYPVLGKMSHNGLPVFRTVTSMFSPNDSLSDPDTKVYVIVESQPEPIGGWMNLSKFIAKHIKYPVDARRQRISGSTFIQFTVEKDRTTANYKAVQPLGGGCDEEAIRVLTLFSEQVGWKPGTQNGKPVRVRFVVPVKFMLGK